MRARNKVYRWYKAVSPVIGTILVVIIVVSSITAVMIWGVPYLERTKAEAQQRDIYHQFDLANEAIRELINSGKGSSKEVKISLDSGGIYFKNEQPCHLLYYSTSNSYNFSVSSLDDLDESFNLHMTKGDADKVVIYRFDPETSLPPYYSTSEEPTAPYYGQFLRRFPFNLTDINNTAYKTTSGRDTPPNYMFLTSEYGSTEYQNAGYDDSESNEWHGDIGTDGKYVNLLYKMKIGDYNANVIKKMDLKWKGIDTLSDGGYQGFYLWNQTSSSWEQIGGNGIAVRFDGLNDRVNIPCKEYLKYRGGTLTICAWIYVEDGETNGKIISKPWNGQGQYNYWLYLESGKVALYVGNGTFYKYIVDPDPISTKEWHYVVGVLHNDGSMKLYIDGELKASDTYSITDWTPSQGDTNVDLCVGSLYPYGSEWAGNEGSSFRGMISNICIYNKTLSQSEIVQNMYGDIVTDGLIGWWKLDDAHGIIVHDLVKHDDGTLMDGCKWVLRRGTFALDFDGIDDYVKIPYNPTFDFSSSLSIEVWVKIEEQTASTTIVKKGPQSGGGAENTPFCIAISEGKVMFFGSNGATWIFAPGFEYTPNVWTHIVGTFDGDTARIYENGIIKAEVTGIEERIFTDGSDLYFGTKWGSYFNGAIAEVRIYDRALTESEILQNHKGNVTKDGLVSWWKFDEGYGNVLHDCIDYNHGRIYGARWKDYKNFALQFNGINDYVSGTGYGYHKFDSITLVAIVKQAGWHGYHEPIFSWANNTEGIYLILDSNKQIKLGVESNGNLYHTSLYQIGDLYINKWVMYTVTWNGYTSEVKLYIDKDLVNKTKDIYPKGVIDLTNVTFAFGKSTTEYCGEPTSRYWGDIDAILVYDKVLDDGEVERLYRGDVITDGLVSWWDLDEGYGNIVHNKVSYGNGFVSKTGDDSGIIYGADWVYVDDGSIYFDGTDDYVTGKATGTIGNFTILVKAKQEGWHGYHEPIFSWANSTDGIYLVLSSEKELIVGVEINDRFYYSGLYKVDDTFLGKWVTYAAKWDGSRGRVGAYINGELVGESGSYPTGMIDLKNVTFCIGKSATSYWGETRSGFWGKISELLLYSRDLSDEEIRTVSSGGTITNGLMAWWRFDEAKGIVLHDYARNNIGKLVNGPIWSPVMPPIDEIDYRLPIMGVMSNYVDESNYVKLCTVGGKGENFSAPTSCTAWYYDRNKAYCTWIDAYNEEEYHVQYRYSIDGGNKWTDWLDDPNSPYYPDVTRSIPIYLGPEKEIEFRVGSVKGGIPSKDWSTSGITYTAPGRPANVQAVPLNAKSIRVSWTDNSSYESGYTIYRSENRGEFVFLTNVSANTVYYTDNSVTPGNKYKYRVYAYKILDYPKITVYSDFSDSESVSPGQNTPPVNTPPVKPSNPYPANGAPGVSTSVTLSWSCSDPDGDPLTYDVYFGTAANPPKVISNQTGMTYNPGTLSKGTTYYWRIVAWDNKGASNSSDVWNFTTAQNSPPSATAVSPSGIIKQDFYPPRVYFDWNFSDPDGDPQSHFQLQVATDPYFSNIVLDTGIIVSSETSYLYEGDKLDYDIYYWRVKVKDGYEWSTWSNSLNFKILGEFPPPCFLSGTKILLADGSTKNIEEIKVGDMVRSYDTETGKLGVGKVTEVFHHSKEEMEDYYLVINGGLLKVTPHHLIYVNGGWIQAGKIKVGDKLLGSYGERIVVYSVNRVYKKVATFNIEVENHHTYIANGIVVHNQKGVYCLSGDTRVRMNDGVDKTIKDIDAGDEIISYDPVAGVYELCKVKSVKTSIKRVYSINNGLLNITDSHPIYAKKIDGYEGWVALDPSKAERYYGLETIRKLEKGDILYQHGRGWNLRITSIEPKDVIEVYSLELPYPHTFFANGILVGAVPARDNKASSHTMYENYVELSIYFTQTDSSPPSTIITSTNPALVDGKTTSSTITFYWYSTDNYCPREDLRYKWMLVGKDTDWTATWSSQTYVVYNDIAPGDYTFKVRAKDLAGNVERPSSLNTLSFTVLTPSEPIDISAHQGSTITVSTSDDIKGFVLIDLYNGSLNIGKIWLLTPGEMDYRISTSQGAYGVSMLDGGISLLYPDGSLLAGEPIISSGESMIHFHFVHLFGDDFSYSGRGTCKLKFTLSQSMLMQYRITAYNMRYQFFGESSGSWINYFKIYHGFFSIGENEVAKFDQPLTLLLGYSSIKVKEVGFG